MTSIIDIMKNPNNLSFRIREDHKYLYKLKYLTQGKGGYIRFILLFGVLFSILQVTDLTITYFALQNPQNQELNPFYNEEWFIPFKLTMVLIIMPVMHSIPKPNRMLAKGAMVGMIYMYLFINFNNLYFLFNS